MLSRLIKVVLLFAVGLIESAYSNAAAESHLGCEKITINTPNHYSPKFVTAGDIAGSKEFKFSVKTCNDAHITLQPDNRNITELTYLIVLGGWTNTRSAIRRSFHSHNEVALERSGVVNCSQERSFWITWNGGKVKVGTGLTIADSTLLMEYSDPSPLPISAVTISTGWGASGVWQVSTPVQDTVAIHTPDVYDYKFTGVIDIASAQEMRFSVKACSAAHISLQPIESTISRLAYSIVLGGWRNTKSAIKRSVFGAPNEVEVNRTGLLSCNEYRAFWITWSGGRVKVGTGHVISGRTLLMEYVDPSPLSIAATAVSTGFGATGLWQVVLPVTDIITINTAEVCDYQTVPVGEIATAKEFKFKVKACNDVHITLQPTISVSTRSAYEIVLGGWNNTRSAIRRSMLGRDEVNMHHAGVLDCNQERQFWITWKDGTIRVGTGTSYTVRNLLMEYVDPSPLPVASVAISTGWGSTGIWKIAKPVRNPSCL